MLATTIFISCLLLSAQGWTVEPKDNLTPYNLQHSKDYTIFASVAACPQTCIQSWTCKTGASQSLSEVSYYQNTTVKAGVYIGYSSGRNLIVIAFRGSANLNNWIEEANFEKAPYIFCIRCQIHSGFYADYLLFEAAINNKIVTLVNKYPAATVLVTGHNLGGALAMVCGLELKRVYPSIRLQIHTYGAPRIGDVQLARHMNNKIQNIYRVVRERDIVPHLPPDLPKFDYHHSAYEIFFDKDMTAYKTCSDSGEDRECSNQYFPNYNLEENGWYFRDIEKPQC